MNRTLQFIIGLIAILLALAAGFYGRNQYLKEVSTYQVPVPVQPIPAYTLLSAEHFQMREMPRTLQALPYSQSLDDLVGKISMVPLPVGLPVPQTSSAPVAKFRLADATFEVISIPVEPVSAVGGQIRIGERVNLYQVLPEEELEIATTVTKSSNSGFKSERIASSILVVDVRSAQGVSATTNHKSEESSTFSGGSQNEQVQILTLAIDPSLVETILNAVAISMKQGGLLWTTLALP